MSCRDALSWVNPAGERGERRGEGKGGGREGWKKEREGWRKERRGWRGGEGRVEGRK